MPNFDHGHVFQVLDWNEHYENAKSRTIERCSHVYVPNKQHGEGFRYIMSQMDGLAIYAVFNLILGACSQHAKRDGWLTNNGKKDGKPWTAKSLSMRWWRREVEVLRALEVMCSDHVGWIRRYPSSVPATDTCTPIEGKGRELKGIEEQSVANATDDAEAVAAERQQSPEGDPPGFVLFWNEYPSGKMFPGMGTRKKGRAKCLRIWKRTNLEPIAETVVSTLRRCKASQDWRKERGKYVPGPEPWLNDTPWETDAAEMVDERPPQAISPARENAAEKQRADADHAAIIAKLDALPAEKLAALKQGVVEKTPSHFRKKFEESTHHTNAMLAALMHGALETQRLAGAA